MKQLLSIPPKQATQEVRDVSVTERGQFRTCRRRWKLQTLDNLEPKVPDPSLPFGTGIHSALEAYHSPKGTPDKALRALNKWYADTLKQWEKGGASTESLDTLHQHFKLGVGMLDHYVVFDQRSPVQIEKVLAVEGVWTGRKTKVWRPDGYSPEADVYRHPSGRLLIPIVDPDTKAPVSSNSCLSARLDLITLRKTPKAGLWVVDHKTASHAPDIKGVEFDDQFTGYDYVLWRMTGEVPRGVVHNILIKKEVGEPRWLKNDKLSTAKDQLTTPDLYREAIKQAGLMGPAGTILSDPHAECLDALLAKGYDPWFRRVETTRNLTQLENFERRLFHEYNDMVIVKSSPDLQYPNPIVAPFGVCQTCPVNRICLAMEDGSDWQGVIETSYQEAEDRKA